MFYGEKKNRAKIILVSMVTPFYRASYAINYILSTVSISSSRLAVQGSKVRTAASTVFRMRFYRSTVRAMCWCDVYLTRVH